MEYLLFQISFDISVVFSSRAAQWKKNLRKEEGIALNKLKLN